MAYKFHTVLGNRRKFMKFWHRILSLVSGTLSTFSDNIPVRPILILSSSLYLCTRSGFFPLDIPNKFVSYACCIPTHPIIFHLIILKISGDELRSS
jgi:hypothetical protein